MAKWTDEQVLAVWGKGTVDPNNDPAVWRKDQCGAWMGFGYHNDRDSEYGWEIDHITPVADGGTDALSNLRPLQWKNNANRQDGRLTCPIKANGVRNEDRSKND